MNDMGSGYFKDALTWLKERHGANNVICAGIHVDETSPHLVAYAAPMTKDGRLAARDFLGGPKVMRQLQDGFHASCGASYGLLRGVQASKAKHEDVGRFYNALSTAKKAPRLTSLDYAKEASGHETDNWKAAVELAQANSLASVSLTRQRKSLLSRIKALDAHAHKARSVENQLSRLREELVKREDRVRVREVEASELRKSRPCTPGNFLKKPPSIALGDFIHLTRILKGSPNMAACHPFLLELHFTQPTLLGGVYDPGNSNRSAFLSRFKKPILAQGWYSGLPHQLDSSGRNAAVYHVRVHLRKSITP